MKFFHLLELSGLRYAMGSVSSRSLLEVARDHAHAGKQEQSPREDADKKDHGVLTIQRSFVPAAPLK
jgi:hypothetical protein